VERLRRTLVTIQKYLGKLGPTHKMLIGSLSVIGLMTLFLVAQYAGRPALVELLPGASPEDQARAVAFVESRGIEHRERDGRLMVPAGQRSAIFAQLSESGQAPPDQEILFRNLLEKQSWSMSRTQSERLYLIALQNELARVISNYDGIGKATVLLDVPEPSGLGRIVRRPTASATVRTDSGAPVSQRQVDAIAAQIAGARAGLEVQNVRIVDAATGRQRRATSEDDLIPTTYLEQAAKVERLAREKFLAMLSYIPGGIVTVTAQVDVTRRSGQTKRYLDKGQGTIIPLVTESTTSSTDSQSSSGAEPGVRSNASVDIRTAGGAGGTKSEQSQEDTTFQPFVGEQVENVVDPRGMPTWLAVSVNVPWEYVAQRLRDKRRREAAGAGADKDKPIPEPTEAEVQARFDQVERTMIEASITPHLPRITQADGSTVVGGDVVVSLIPGGATAGLPDTGETAGAAAGGPVGSLLAMGGGMVQTIVLGALAVVSIGMMLMMVRKAGRQAPLPTPEELVGLPSRLETESAVVGEAEVGDNPLTGIELGDDEVAAQKKLDEVVELVKQSPETTAKLLSRWISEGS